MKKKTYDDNNFQNLLNDLKNLPQVDAPDDFQFKLMARIKNKNFRLKNVDSDFTIFKFLKPAFSLVVVLLLFFVFNIINQDKKSSKIIKSNLKNTKSGSISDSQKNVKTNAKMLEFQRNETKSSEKEFASRNRKSINFFGKTIDIDNALKNNNGTDNEHGVLAGSKEFDGFGMGIPVKNKVIDSMKQKSDSIRNVEKK